MMPMISILQDAPRVPGVPNACAPIVANASPCCRMTSDVADCKARDFKFLCEALVSFVPQLAVES
jgi:hypothetical protein